MQSGINKFPPLSLRKKSASNRSTNYRCKGQWQIQRLEKKKKRGEEVNLHAEQISLSAVPPITITFTEVAARPRRNQPLEASITPRYNASRPSPFLSFSLPRTTSPSPSSPSPSRPSPPLPLLPFRGPAGCDNLPHNDAFFLLVIESKY